MLRRRSAQVADSGQTAGFAVKIAVGGDLELVNRDTPLSGYSEDVVQLTCRPLALRPANRPEAAERRPLAQMPLTRIGQSYVSQDQMGSD